MFGQAAPKDALSGLNPSEVLAPPHRARVGPRADAMRMLILGKYDWV